MESLQEIGKCFLHPHMSSTLFPYIFQIHAVLWSSGLTDVARVGSSQTLVWDF